MRTAGLRVFSAVVLTFALLSSTVLPIAAFAGPMLHRTPTSPDDDDLAGADGADGRGQDGAGGPVDAVRRLLEGAGADYSRLLGLGPSTRSGGMGGVDQPSLLVIPEVVLAAYRNAARNASSVVAGCTVDWPVLAGIGRVESRHGLFGGADTVIDTQGNIAQHIVGPALDGRGVASIPDSDKGRWDGDDRWDHAVGLMQFIPSSWRHYGQDGNADGVRDPHNVFDATLAAVDHLCSTQPGDLADDTRLERALFSYNRSRRYVADVRRWIDIYRSADPAELSLATTAGQANDERRRNPFTGLLSTVAFDGSLPGGLGLGNPLGSGTSTAPVVSTPPTTRGAPGSDRTGPASERTQPPKPKASPSPKASKQPSPKPKATPKPSPTAEPSAPSDPPTASPGPSDSAPASPSEQGSSAPAPPQAAPQPSPAAPSPQPQPASPSPKPQPAPPSPKPPPPPPPPPPKPAPAPEPAPATPTPAPEPTPCPTPSAASEPGSPPDPACEPAPAP